MKNLKGFRLVVAFALLTIFSVGLSSCGYSDYGYGGYPSYHQRVVVTSPYYGGYGRSPRVVMGGGRGYEGGEHNRGRFGGGYNRGGGYSNNSRSSRGSGRWGR